MPVGDENSFLQQLTAVVNLLAQGQGCATAAPSLAGAGLVAVPKPNGGVRPIAIGEIYRRLTGKCLLQQVRAEARSFLWPAQVGVCVPLEAEVVVHSVRGWLQRHANTSGKVLVKLDFSNAFNTVSREAVLQATHNNFPSLSRWASWCYGNASNLRFGKSSVQSASGVQQGDPLVSRWLRKLASKLTWPSSTLTMAFWPGTLRRSPPHCRCFTSVRWPSDSNSTSKEV